MRSLAVNKRGPNAKICTPMARFDDARSDSMENRSVPDWIGHGGDLLDQ